MAWDSPSGILSPNERDRLKREAEIFAEAQAENAEGRGTACLRAACLRAA